MAATIFIDSISRINMLSVFETVYGQEKQLYNFYKNF